MKRHTGGLWRIATVYDDSQSVRLVIAVAVDRTNDGHRNVMLFDAGETLQLRDGELSGDDWPEGQDEKLVEIVRIVARDLSGDDPVPAITPGRIQRGGSA